MNQLPRVLQVLPNLISGGVERGTLEIAAALVKKEYQALVCSNGGVLVADLEKIGAIHFKLPVHTKNPITALLNIYRLQQIIKKNQINIVHARSRAPAWSCYFACKLTKAKFVTTFHGTYGSSNSIKRFYNSIMLRGEKVIAISKFIYNHILANYNVDKDRLIIINRGVDINYFDSIKVTSERISTIKAGLNLNDEVLKGKKVLLLPARFARWKGHMYLLDMLAQLKEKNFICLFVGLVAVNRQEYLNEIKNKVTALNLESKIFIGSEVKDVAALYMIADYIVSPSLDPEAFGRTIVEAQAMGKVVIATNHGGASETIVDNETGFHIPLNNVKAAAEILDKVLSLSAERYTDIAKRGVKVVRSGYTTETMCSQTLDLYQSILAS